MSERRRRVAGQTTTTGAARAGLTQGARPAAGPSPTLARPAFVQPAAGGDVLTTTEGEPPRPAGQDERTSTAALVRDPENRRTHTPRNVAMIAASLRAVGPARSIVIDEDNRVLAGNGLLDGAAAVGIERVRIVEADGAEIIAVRRRHLSPADKRDLAIYDNRTAELAEWNLPQLEADLLDGADALRPFFTDDELRRMKLLERAATNVAGQDVPAGFQIVITCTDEAQQATLLERFASEGLTCKALVS